MYQQSLLIYEHFRYLKLSLVLVLLAVVAYLFEGGAGPPNGGTWVGYGLGGLGFALVLWLMWLGLRKRHYRSRFGTLQGWVSAHVYLGIALVFIATLHTGFQFGFNVHTLSYVLMWLVVCSGCYGVYVYLRYPGRLSKTRAGTGRGEMLREISELDHECLELADTFDETLHQLLACAIDKTVLGGTAWQRLARVAERDENKRLAQFLKQRDSRQSGVAPHNHAYNEIMYMISDRMANADNPEHAEKMRRIVELLGRKNVLIKRLRQTLQYQTLLEIWLYFHIPLSFAMLAALIVHIVTVFLYW